MEASDGDRDAGLAERACNVESAGKLVGLNAHQSRRARSRRVSGNLRQQAGNIDARIGLVDRLDVDGDARTKRAACRGVLPNAVKGSERIRRDDRFATSGSRSHRRRNAMA